MLMIVPRRILASAFAVALLAPAEALAHHVMDGQMPLTFAQGLLSGLGHPIIGFDHLAAIVAAGLAAAFVPAGLTVIAAFIGATLVGTGLHLALVTIPGAEIVVTLSVLLFGGLIAIGARLPVAAWAGLFAVAGLFHGYAYGESIVGAEQSPLAAYILGFAVIQFAIAEGSRRAALGLAGSWSAPALRVAGGAVLGVGLVFAGNLILPT